MNRKAVIKTIGFHASDFLSLHDLSLRLENLNILVGPNAGGKSNVVKGLRTLATMVQEGPYELARRLGVAELWEVVFKHSKNLNPNIRLDLCVNGRSGSYEVNLGQDSFCENVTIEKTKVFENPASSYGRLGSYIDKDRVVRSISLDSFGQYFNRFLHFSSFSRRPPSDILDETHDILDFIREMRFYSFEPTRIRACIPITAEPTLDYDGHNLARTLLDLYHTKKKVFSKVEDCLKSLVPEIEEVILDFPRGTTDVRLRILERNFEEPHSSYLISDGTLRLLAFITAVYAGASFVTFEEPENCIHPHLLEALVDLLHKAPCQVLVTTHSPHLLDHVEPHEVVVMEKIEGETKAVRLSEHEEVETVKNLLKEGSKVGEAWYSGIFGGVPKFS